MFQVSERSKGLRKNGKETPGVRIRVRVRVPDLQLHWRLEILITDSTRLYRIRAVLPIAATSKR